MKTAKKHFNILNPVANLEDLRDLAESDNRYAVLAFTAYDDLDLDRDETTGLGEVLESLDEQARDKGIAEVVEVVNMARHVELESFMAELAGE